MSSNVIYRQLASTVVGHVLVSTAYSSISYHGSEERGWETVVYPYQRSTELVWDYIKLECKRYSSEADALVGHELISANWDMELRKLVEP